MLLLSRSIYGNLSRVSFHESGGERDAEAQADAPEGEEALPLHRPRFSEFLPFHAFRAGENPSGEAFRAAAGENGAEPSEVEQVDADAQQHR